tara:strand:+ start:784 stop:1170 length:387 start_codon:yes stop_codon:yes gene_type:complete
MKILICGLPGSGKTSLAKILTTMFNAIHLNDDEVQADRMKSLAEEHENKNRVVVADFVCPTAKTREEFGADYTVWMNTLKESKYENFEEPENPDFIARHFDAQMWAFLIKQDILDKHGSLGPHSDKRF